MIYLDHSATTRPFDEVISTMADVMSKVYGNPSSLHGLGLEAERLLKQAKEVIADELSVSPKEIIFTSGGSESNNLAIKGAARQYKNRGNHLITTMVEHAAVYEVMEQLEEEGFRITILPVNREGVIDVDQLKQEITEETTLVSVMHVNNEIGAIQPIAEIGTLLKQYPKILFHVDGVQGLGKVPLSLRENGVDLYSLSAHKFHGPKGMGLLYKREGISLHPIINGGGQEGGMRSGTENIPGIVGMAKALRMIKKLGSTRKDHLLSLRETLLKGLDKLPFPHKINSPYDGAPHIIHVSFPDYKGEVVVHALEEKGIYVSTKSACSSKKDKPSRILQAIGLTNEEARGAIRISLAYETTTEDISSLLEALEVSLASLEKVAK